MITKTDLIFLLFMAMLLVELFGGIYLLDSLGRGWLIEPENARQILSDIAKISGTILAIFTAFTFFMLREHLEFFKNVKQFVSFMGLYFSLTGLIFLCFYNILKIGSEPIDFSEISAVFVAFPFVLYFLFFVIVSTFAIIKKLKTLQPPK